MGWERYKGDCDQEQGEGGTFIDGTTNNIPQCLPETYPALLCSLQNCIRSLWSQEKDDPNNRQVDQEHIAVASALTDKEVDGVDAKVDCVAHERQTWCRGGDTRDGWWFEQVDDKYE